MKAISDSILCIFAFCFFLGSCTKKESNPVVTTPTDTTKKNDTVALGNYTTILPDTSTFYHGVQLGTVNDPLIQSASGLSASRAYPNMFWTHNDAGKYNYIFLLDSTGKRKAFFQVTGAVNTDWTDMAIGPGPAAGVNYLYLADIGDSKVSRYNVSVQRFPEPHAPLDTSGKLGTTEKAEFINFQYPDGPRDAESILLDATTKDIYIIDKSTPADVYIAPYPQPVDSLFTIKKIARILVSSLRGGAMSSDGQEILLKNLTAIYYWKRHAGESVLNTLLSQPVQEPYTVEQHGEAICWSVSGDSYWTTSKVMGNFIPDFTVYRRK
jgi:hypothetical protein